MHAKHILAALAIATTAGTAMAIDATQLDVPPSTLTREEVRAALDEAKRDGTLMSGGEATVFVDRPVAASRSREEVREEGRLALRAPFSELYAG